MKQISKIGKDLWMWIITVIALLPATVAMAQDGTKKIDIDISTGKDAAGPAWYGQWWIWAIGLAIFIIVIVAITRGGNKSSN